MIFIAFLSWVSGRIKEAAEARRARMSARKAAQQARNSAQPLAPPSPYRPAARPAASPAPSPRATPEPEVPKTFRELFEILREPVAPETAATPEPRPFVPPPLPLPASAKTQPPLSDADKLFYGTPRAVAVSSSPLRVEKVRGKTSSTVNRFLKSRGTLRQAFILKELLDPPVSMRE